MYKKLIRKKVIACYREIYKSQETHKEILNVDPNEFDMDPSIFYETLEDEFGLNLDHDKNPYYGGLGGTVSETIDFIEKNTNGIVSLNKEQGVIDSFLYNYSLNINSISKKDDGIIKYYDLFSLMESNSKAKLVKTRFKLILKNDDWDNFLSEITTYDNYDEYKEVFNKENLKLIAEKLKNYNY